MIVDGVISLFSAISGVVVTEATGRQRVSFRIMPAALAGVGTARTWTPRAVNATSFSFPAGLLPAGMTLVGRAIWDAPAGGNLLLVLPYGSGARTVAAGGPVEVLEAGDLTLEGAAFDAVFSGTVAAAATVGACWDRSDIVGRRTPAANELQGPDGDVLLINRAVLSAGVALVVNRGTLQSAASFAAL